MLSTTRAQGCWLRNGAAAVPSPQPFPRCQAVPIPATSPAPRQQTPLEQPAAPAHGCREPCASGWGTAGVFIFLFLPVVSWPAVRWGWARKMNWCEQSQAPAEPGSFPAARAPQGRGRGKGHSSWCCGKAHTSQGCTAPHPPPHCPWSCLSCCGIDLYFLTATHIHQ